MFFDEAIERAKQLDAEFKRTGKPVGPMHGLPIRLVSWDPSVPPFPPTDPTETNILKYQRPLFLPGLRLDKGAGRLRWESRTKGRASPAHAQGVLGRRVCLLRKDDGSAIYGGAFFRRKTLIYGAGFC